MLMLYQLISAADTADPSPSFPSINISWSEITVKLSTASASLQYAEKYDADAPINCNSTLTSIEDDDDTCCRLG